MLLSVLALITGWAIGRVRGGRTQSLAALRLHGAPWLVAGVAAVLIVNWIGPASPLVWMLIAYVCFAIFGVRNLQLTGMVVLLIGLLMNFAPMLANGAVPVSERALSSVGLVDATGEPVLDSIRESNETATSFAVFGDIVPVPIVNQVVSLGDLVILVALVDIAMNVLLLGRSRELDPASFSYTANASPEEPAEVIDLREPASKTRGPAHAATGRPKFARLRSLYVPAHAAAKSGAILPGVEASTSGPSSEDDEVVIVLNDETSEYAYIEQPPPPTPVVDTRPIIDLTSSPTDEQLCEFLRRRAEADRTLAEQDATSASHPSPRRRMGRKASQTVHA